MYPGKYPPTYHRAVNALVAFGGYPPEPGAVRCDLAAALRAMRATDHEWARQERHHMLYISGQFPVKP